MSAEPSPVANRVARRTPLHELHRARGARMAVFAGYELPLHFTAGVLKEHVHTRAAAGLFDVSHMGQIVVQPRDGDMASVARALEGLLPADVLSLAPGRQRYTMLTDAQGGILDDLMIANLGDRFLLVVNASRKEADLEHLRRGAGDAATFEPLDRALLALQGPRAEDVLARVAPECRRLGFMDVASLAIAGAACLASRSGYTGEDGFEISVPAERACDVAEALLACAEVLPVGLAARDSLRLEAGLCLHGADITAETTPIEAGLAWTIAKVRRQGGGRAGGFPGADIILAEIGSGPRRLRVGVRVEGRAPVRAGASLYAQEEGGEPIGSITSGGFGPTVDGPVAMGYVPSAMAPAGTRLFAELRGKRLAATIASLPFVPHRYKRG